MNKIPPTTVQASSRGFAAPIILAAVTGALVHGLDTLSFQKREQALAEQLKDANTAITAASPIVMAATLQTTGELPPFKGVSQALPTMALDLTEAVKGNSNQFVWATESFRRRSKY